MKIILQTLKCRYWIIHICLPIFIPTASKLNGGIKEATYMSIHQFFLCLSDCLCNRARSVSFSLKNNQKFVLYTKIAYNLRACHEFYRVIQASSTSLGRKGHYLCLVYIFLLKRYSRFLFHIRICYDLKISHYLVQRSFLGGTKSLDGKVHYYLPIYIFCMEKQWKFLLYTTIAFYLWVSHDSDPISFGQVQCYWKEM